MISNLKNSETQVPTILEHLIDEEELSPQPIFDSEETMSAATLKSAEFDNFSILDEYLSKPEETLDVSLHKPNITIAQSIYDEVEKDIEIVSERPKEPQKESKEDQPLVLVKPPTLPSIPIEFKKWVVVKEHSQIFYTADTFVSDDRDKTQSYV
ncbi:hypothetical protein Sjap_005135 [Stephania japonica]|uniref:Uncharacterized protein n=1 Tax=Stephania japonica TaxID=461633 RepID=A0AAP0K5S4_9MAGN